MSLWHEEYASNLCYANIWNYCSRHRGIGFDEYASPGEVPSVSFVSPRLPACACMLVRRPSWGSISPTISPVCERRLPFTAGGRGTESWIWICSFWLGEKEIYIHKRPFARKQRNRRQHACFYQHRARWWYRLPWHWSKVDHDAISAAILTEVEPLQIQSSRRRWLWHHHSGWPSPRNCWTPARRTAWQAGEGVFT